MLRDFAAIDFETANQQASSICSVGVVIVRDGEIVDKFYSLIYPYPDFFTYWTTRVHGLTMQDVEDALPFPDVWEQIADKIDGLPLVAHNSPFDERCLKAAFAAYRMDYPDYVFYDTCRETRRQIGSQLPNHQLHTVAEFFGYDLKTHHHALADAEACAVIAMNIL